MIRANRRSRRKWPASLLASLLVATCLGATGEQLAIVNAHLLDSQDGYPVLPGSTYFAGERIHLTFNIAGFRVSELGLIRLTHRVDFSGPTGEPFSTSQGGRISEEIFPQDKDWLPIVRASAMIPYHAESGDYSVRLSVKDNYSGREATQTVSLTVRGQDVAGAKGLMVREFSFSRSEEGERLPKAAYRPGDTLWGSFFITGFSIDDDNAFHVDSDLKVVSKTGKVLYAFTPDDEQGSPFYPRRWVPAKFHIRLDKDIPRGQYSILLSVRDRLSGKEVRTKQDFRVR